jgi:transcriptional regulator with XRE-family HTH domain
MSEALVVRGSAELDESARALGVRIRRLRTERGLTLIQLAASAELSHSFLSQVERGIERLSMASLFRIARALGTTQHALLTEEGTTTRGGRFSVFRRDADSTLDAGGGPVTVLAHDAPPFVPMIFDGAFTDGEWWQHDEEEFLHVLAGEVVVSLGDEEHRLAEGDSVYYEGGVRHRWRTEGDATCRILVVKESRPAR